MAWGSKNARARLLCGAAAASLIMWAGAANAQDASINIPPQSLATALYTFAAQSGHQVMFAPELAGSKMTRGVAGMADQKEALRQLLAGTELAFKQEGDTFLIVSASDPQSGSAAGDGADQGTVAALIVTAQKREEQIQDVPIAISAFTEKSLEEQKIEGGFDLLKAIPNVTFSKNNFTSYNFSIRGIGTKAVSATTDPAVAVSFNNTALIQNRLFEQEYFDVERVEVLRGPQGTLYGRNATAGVINVISAKPNLQEFSGWIKGEVGNYHAKRLSAMVNVPLVKGKLGIRFAGALTDRQGYDYNEQTHHAINGRDLWSGRITIGFNPTERIRSDLIWERFNEDDNRSRTGKQLCHKDQGPTEVGGEPIDDNFVRHYFFAFYQADFSTGCKMGSLYDKDAFSAPNGLALPFVWAIQAYPGVALLPWGTDPYEGLKQSTDLRTISSFRDPIYRAKADVVELNIDVDLTDNLALTSQSAYDKDSTYSFQDYNRFNSKPIFADTAGLTGDQSPYRTIAPGGVFCDPQLGCSNRLAGFDIAKAKASQFTQEVRLQSDFDGPVNFSVGVNYTRFKVLADYYVMYNVITAFALVYPFNNFSTDYTDGANIYTCGMGIDGFGLPAPGVPSGTPGSACPYIDPNPVESINGEGHNYFRSKNPYSVRSGAAFGEVYWKFSDNMKLTAGLRYTDDRKTFTPIPSQVLLAEGMNGGGDVNRGYPARPDIKQHWGEWTGRLGVDWKADLPFTDQTLLYAFYSRGYKGGGANPPIPGFSDNSLLDLAGISEEDQQAYIGTPFERFLLPIVSLKRDYSDTFRPEFVNAFELGSKNTLLGGALTLNGDAFFYDYKDYQVSQIRDRTAVNENFDARVWGLELETVFAPSRDLQFIGNVGYLHTRIGDNARSIDVMNRTQGDPAYMVVKPWVQLPSNCVVPVEVVKAWLDADPAPGGAFGLCGGYNGFAALYNAPPIDPSTGEIYTPDTYPEINGGVGKWAHLGGNELPNSPHWTVNLGGQYGHDILDGSWRATVRADAYWQSQSWARVYNDNPYDKLHGWYNVNLSVWLERPEDDLKIEFYAKNLLDKTPITDAFLNSDDTALTTNVFVLDPRLIGLSIRKGF